MKEVVTKQAIRVAIVSYDVKWLSVAANYFKERKEFAFVDCYQRGEQVLASLAAGLNSDVVILDEQLQDMDLLDFMQTYATMNLTHSSILLGVCNKKYLGYTGDLLSLGLTDFIAKPIQLANLTERVIQLYRVHSGGKVKELCEAMYRAWGVELNDSCNYLTDAVRVANDSARKLAIGKEIVWNVAELHGSTANAVDSALRRLVDRIEANATPAYCFFKQEMGLDAVKPTVQLLVYAMKAKIKQRELENSDGQSKAEKVAQVL